MPGQRSNRMATVERIDRPGIGNDDRQDREKQKAVDLAVGQIEKQFGKGSIMRLGQKGAIQPIDFIPTGAISIDYALGVGGVPRGRVVEIFGPESSGKTTLSLQVIAEAQKLGGMAARWRGRGPGGGGGAARGGGGGGSARRRGLGRRAPLAVGAPLALS